MYAPHVEPERNLLIVGADGYASGAPLTVDRKSGVLHVAWSHDGTRVSLTAGDELRIWDAQRDDTLLIIETFATSVAWSPDDRRLALIEYDDEDESNKLRLRDALGGAVLASPDMDANTYFGRVAWAPDGVRIAYAIFNVIERENDSGLITSSALNIWDGSDRNPPVPLFQSQDWISDLDWSPDSRFLVASIRGGVQVLDAGDGHIVASLIPELKRYSGEREEAIYLIEHVDWSPDGRRIAASGISSGMGLSEMRSAALVWDLTLIPEGPTRAFIHSSNLIPDAAADG